ncbi:MAG: hypothetical protein FGM16_04155 [Flavobacterium sp.]|jgi:hypothetical protein|nr:hypothetical protein [Flavobacterium sp.]
MYDQLVFIHQQLKQREVGIELQRFTNVVTKPGVSYYEVPAYNEYLLLTNASALPIGTRIISDTNSIEIAVSQKTLVAMEEFSGLIAIELPNEVQEYPILEFIQIVKE